MTVAMVPVTRSTNVRAVGHDPDTAELHVEYRSGGTYVYGGVSADKHAELIAAPSIGTHLHTAIKPHHAYRRAP